MTQACCLEKNDVFISGQDGYHTFRIPAVIVTWKGTVLAFCEGRTSLSDHAENDIALKCSTDGGRSWSALQVAAADSRNCLNNPQAVVVGETGRVLLMYQRYPHGIDEHDAVPGHEGDRICRSFLLCSDDEGKTWSGPRDITRSVKRPTVATSIASGPGIGIQLRRGKHRGRIVMPFNQGPWGDWKDYAVYSDDQGERWQYGEVAPETGQGPGNEVQMVELAEGTVMMNSRTYEGSKCRKVALSEDGGETWSGLVDDPTLIEPGCQAGILRYTDPLDDQKSRILFSNPESTQARINGTVKLSYDEGQTWPVSKVVYEGEFAYSCLTVLADKSIGLLFERDDYKKITFACFGLDWLTDGKDTLDK